MCGGQRQQVEKTSLFVAIYCSIGPVYSSLIDQLEIIKYLSSNMKHGKPKYPVPCDIYCRFFHDELWQLCVPQRAWFLLLECSHQCGGVGYGKLGRLFQILVDAPKWITWPALDEQARILNEPKLETRVIAIGERLGGMWSVCRPKLGHPARRDLGPRGARGAHTPNVTVAIGDVGEQSVRGASFIF